MTRIDITADLNSEDETGFVWTFLDEADDPSIIRRGEVVVAGSVLTPAGCEVIDLVDKPFRTIVHLRVLPERSGSTAACSTPSALDLPRSASAHRRCPNRLTSEVSPAFFSA